MLTARQLYFEAVKVGDELPPLVKPPVDRLQIARYAGAAQDWNPLTIDEPHARNSGFPSALAPGMIAMGFLGELVVDWVRGARLRKFGARFVKIIWPGDVLTARGRVVERRFEEPGQYTIGIEVWAENQRGELVVRGLATFQLYYSAEDEARQRAGQGPLVVTREEEDARLAKLSRAQPPRPAAPAGRPLAPPKALPTAVLPAPAQRPPVPPPAPSLPGFQAAPAAPPPSSASATAPPARPPSAPPAARPAAQAPAPRPSKAARPASRPAAKRVGSKRAGAGKGKAAARPHAARRPARKEKAASARARSGSAARKPNVKKRR